MRSRLALIRSIDLFPRESLFAVISASGDAVAAPRHVHWPPTRKKCSSISVGQRIPVRVWHPQPNVPAMTMKSSFAQLNVLPSQRLVPESDHNLVLSRSKPDLSRKSLQIVRFVRRRRGRGARKRPERFSLSTSDTIGSLRRSMIHL